MAGEIIGVKIGETAHLIDYAALANVPTASENAAGVVKVDNDSIKVNADGQLYVAYPSAEGVGF